MQSQNVCNQCTKSVCLTCFYVLVGEDACIVARLFQSSLVAVVGQKEPRKLRVYHFKVRFLLKFPHVISNGWNASVAGILMLKVDDFQCVRPQK